MNDMNDRRAKWCEMEKLIFKAYELIWQAEASAIHRRVAERFAAARKLVGHDVEPLPFPLSGHGGHPSGLSAGTAGKLEPQPVPPSSSPASDNDDANSSKPKCSSGG